VSRGSDANDDLGAPRRANRPAIAPTRLELARIGGRENLIRRRIDALRAAT
jgi:hypothetical protein